MSTDTIKTIAIGLISIPSRPVYHEALLGTALTAALAAYSALRPLKLATTYTDETELATGTDENGDYRLFTIPLTTGIHYATEVTIGDESFKFRITSTDETSATVKIYTEVTDVNDVTIWRPVAHSAAVATWPAHHEIIIAFMTASFYLNAWSLADANIQRAANTQQLAASYYGRASATLTQTAQLETHKQ